MYHNSVCRDIHVQPLTAFGAVHGRYCQSLNDGIDNDNDDDTDDDVTCPELSVSGYVLPMLYLLCRCLRVVPNPLILNLIIYIHCDWK